MQCHRSKLDQLLKSLAGMPTDSAPYAGKAVDELTDEMGLRILSRMERRARGRYDNRMSLQELARLSHRRSRQRASGTRGRR